PRRNSCPVAEELAPEISGQSPKARSGSGTRFTPDRRAEFAGVYNTPTSQRQVGPATMASPPRLVFRRRPSTTCSSPHSATTFHSANKIPSIDPETQKGSCFSPENSRFQKHGRPRYGTNPLSRRV